MSTSMRQTIGRYMTYSKQNIPHFYLTRNVDLSASLRMRSEINQDRSQSERISVNDLLLMAVVLGLKTHPNLNGTYQNEAFLPSKEINLGIAISLEQGLIAPTVLNCGENSIYELSQRARDLAERARAGKLKGSEYSGATFTVSNLGMFGVDVFTAIIVPPQVGILAVGAVSEIFVPLQGQPTPIQQITMTLSADHRAVDGVDGARFLLGIADNLQDPARLF